MSLAGKPTLDQLLRAIQYRDVPRIVPLFCQWAKILTSPDTSLADLALDELRELPADTFSEILRWVDPLTNPNQDICHGLNITQGQTQFNDTSRHVDNFGVRVQNRALLDSARHIMDLRRLSGRKMLLQDYEICIRIAGAASDPHAAIDFFRSITQDGLSHHRNTATWTEFTRSLFLVEPAYYQFDRARAAVQARQSYGNRSRIPPKDVWAMERLRYSMNAIRRLPFGRNRHRTHQDLRSLTGAKKWVQQHWERSKQYGVLINEELKCVTMMSYARSNALIALRGNILWRGFRIQIKENAQTGEASVEGGKPWRPGNPRRPSQRFLYAIVESFGSVSRIRTGLKLLVDISYKHDIPIPHETWSNMLQWAYVSAFKPFRRMRRLQGRYMVYHSDHKDVMEIWKIMTLEPFNVKPTFDDYGVYVKALIIGRNFRIAIDVIRNEAVPYYRQIEEEHFKIVEDEILRGVTEPSFQRLQIEMKKEYVWYHIAYWFSLLLKSSSKATIQREGRFTQVVIPDLIAEFGDFFQHQVRYRTTHGRVSMLRPRVPFRTDRVLERRVTLPQQLGGMVAKKMEEDGILNPDDPEYQWPQIRQMVVKQFKRQPRARTRATGRAPNSNEADTHSWWRNMFRELQT